MHSLRKFKKKQKTLDNLSFSAVKVLSIHWISLLILYRLNLSNHHMGDVEYNLYWLPVHQRADIKTNNHTHLHLRAFQRDQLTYTACLGTTEGEEHRENTKVTGKELNSGPVSSEVAVLPKHQHGQQLSYENFWHYWSTVATRAPSWGPRMIFVQGLSFNSHKQNYLISLI